MKAISYKIQISDNVIEAEQGFHRIIKEIAIDYLGAIINHTGVYFPEDLDTRVSAGTDAEEIEISSDILDIVESIKDIKEKELKIIKKLNL